MARPYDVVCMTSRQVDLSYKRFLHKWGVGPELGNIIELEPGLLFGKSLENDFFPSPSTLICKRISLRNQVVLNAYALSQKRM